MTETVTVTTGVPMDGFDENISFEGAKPLRLDDIMRRLEESQEAIDPPRTRRAPFQSTEGFPHQRFGGQNVYGIPANVFGGGIYGELGETSVADMHQENVAHDAATSILYRVALHVAATRAIGFGERTRFLAPTAYSVTGNRFSENWLPSRLQDSRSKTDDKNGKKWWDKIESFKKLHDGWDSYRAPAPSPDSITQAAVFLKELAKSEYAPTRLTPSVVGGIGFTFKLGDRKVYVEFRNTGSIHALFSDGISDPVIDRVQTEPAAYANLMARVKKYFYE